jgi:hypothetical protein
VRLTPCNALKQELAIWTAEISSLQDPLSSADKLQNNVFEQELDQLTSAKSERDALKQELATQIAELSSL